MTERVFRRSAYSLTNKTVWTIYFYPPYDNLNTYGGDVSDVKIDGEYLIYKDFYYKRNKNSVANIKMIRKNKIHRKYIKWIEII